MNRTATRDVGMLTQCYDARRLHPITETDDVVVDALLDSDDALRVPPPDGGELRLHPRVLHMRVLTRHGLWSTVGEIVADRHPLVVARCDAAASPEGIAR